MAGRQKRKARARQQARARHGGEAWPGESELRALLSDILDSVDATHFGLPPSTVPTIRLDPAPLDPEVQRLLSEGIGRVEEVLQEPGGDVASALSGLAPLARHFDPRLFDLACRVMLHGHDAELVAFVDAARPVAPAPAEAWLLHDGLGIAAAEIELLRLASLPDGEARLPELDRLLALEPDEALRQLHANIRLLQGAIDRRSYRFDRPGALVVPLLEALTRRFAFLLHTHWGWAGGRVAMARLELFRLLLQRFNPLHDEAATACRECALALPPRTDLAKGASALALDVNAVILDWPRLLDEPGGPYRAAALLEALPLWVRFLESLRLVDARPARTALEMIERSSRMLGPTLAESPPDRALAAAAARLSRMADRAAA